MKSMTSIERVTNTLDLKPVDRIAAVVSPWEETKKLWIEQGHLAEGEDISEHFEQDLRVAGWMNYIADLDFEPEILEETEQTVLTRDGNGAVLRRFKDRTGTPEHVDYTVKNRRGWEEHVKPHLLKVDRRRLPYEEYRSIKKLSAEKQRFFCWHGKGVFELLHPICGHEYMFMGMTEDPDWVKDMVMTCVRCTINHLEVFFAEEGKPDGMFFADDLGFKFKPFISPAMYKEIVQPGQKMLFDYAHSLGCKVILHSCGFVEPLVPGLIEAGMDCLQGMEVKAGMDILRLYEKYGSVISFYGGIDARVLISNDKKAIEEELLKKIPPIINGGGGYILHSDHSEPQEVEYDTVCYFLKRGREIGTITK